MRQVPVYLFIGNGRVARHLKYYFSSLGLHVATWQRSQSIELLQEQVALASHILVLIRDDAIETFIREHLANSQAILVHCSGSLVTPLAVGAHPLMTFTEELYDLSVYQNIPFIVDDTAPAMNELLPGIPNQAARLSAENKAKYHALCVLSGNFSCILWQKLFNSLEQDFNFPSSLAFPYMQQCMQNLLSNPQSALTGPLARGDQVTLQKNLQALATDPFQQVYQSFISCFEQIRGHNK